MICETNVYCQVSYTRVHLSLEQAKEIKAELGGLWRDGTSRPSKTNADLSLDNLLTSKRRSSKQSVVEGGPAVSSPLTSSKKSSKPKRGGHMVETSVNEDEEDVFVKKTPSRNAAKQKLTFATPKSAKSKISN